MTMKREDKAVPGGKFVTKAEAYGMIRSRNIPVLEAGHPLTVKPGVLLQRVKAGSVYRYQLREEGK